MDRWVERKRRFQHYKYYPSLQTHVRSNSINNNETCMRTRDVVRFEREVSFLRPYRTLHKTYVDALPPCESPDLTVSKPISRTKGHSVPVSSRRHHDPQRTTAQWRVWTRIQEAESITSSVQRQGVLLLATTQNRRRNHLQLSAYSNVNNTLALKLKTESI